MEREGEGTG
jgi:hypothetical protein